MVKKKDETVETRIEALIDTIMKLAQGDYTASCEIGENNDEIDALVMGINMMIDDIKTSREALRESEKKFRNLVEHSKDAIVVVQDEVIKFASSVSVDMLGSELDDIVGSNFRSWIVPENLEKVKKIYTARMAGKEVLSTYEIEVIRKDGSTLPVEINAALVDYDDKPADLAFIRDISERNILIMDLEQRIAEVNRNHAALLNLSEDLDESNTTLKRMEAELKTYAEGLEVLVDERTMEVEASRDRLLMVDKLRSEFVDVAAHELRTPLSSLKMYVDMMRGGNIGGFGEDERPILEDMASAIAGIDGLIKQMLEYTRVENRLLDLSFSSGELGDVIGEVFEEFEVQARTCGVSLVFDSEGDTVALFDPEMTKILVANLVSNAIKYSEEKRQVCVHIMGEGDRVVVSVSDKGIGISEEDIPHIFERFFVGDASLTRERDRLGIGLSIAKSIVERHGGRIWAESRVGEGSVFSFEIPREQILDVNSERNTNGER